MDNKQLHDEYRAQLLKANAITIAVVSVVEIVAYLIFVYNGIYDLSISCKYLQFNVAMPIFINILVHTIARKVNKTEKTSYETKNAVVVYAVSVTAIVVAIFHRDYIVTSCAYVFPIVLSALFNRKKLLAGNLIVALISLTVTAGLLIYEGKMNLACMMNIIVLYGFIGISYLAGFVSVDYSKKITGIIESQAIANDKLLVSVLKDQMTDLYNHRAFFMELDVAIQRFKTEETPFCLAMIDVDDFKSVNDDFGHDCGDAVLVTLANILDGHCDQGDRACRYGGEEFAIIFNDKELSRAEQIMTEILDEFRNTKFGFREQPVTFSCGVAQYRIFETRESFFNLADRRMYGVKQSGKNRVSAETI